MTEKDVALSSGRVNLGTRIGLPELVVGFDVDLAALLDCLQVVVARRVEGVDRMPRGRGFSTGCCNASVD